MLLLVYSNRIIIVARKLNSNQPAPPPSAMSLLHFSPPEFLRPLSASHACQAGNNTPENFGKASIETLLQNITVLQIQVRDVFRGRY